MDIPLSLFPMIPIGNHFFTNSFFMNLSVLFSKKGLQLAGLGLLLTAACKKSSTPLPFKTPEGYPAKNVQPTSFTADWEKVGAVGYLLYVATDSNFNHPLNGYNPLSVKTDSAPVTGLTQKSDYYYKVIAIGPQGDSTDFSNIVYSPTPNPGDDRYVYIGSQDTYMYCFYAGNGSKEWAFKSNGDIESTPTISEGMLYFTSTDQRLYALDAITGAKHWEFRSANPILSSPTVGPNGIYLSTWQGGTIYGVNKNGERKWSVTPTPNSYILSSPAYDNGMVFIGGQDKNLYAFNSETGAKVWTAPTEQLINSSPAVSNGVVYVGSFDRYVYALDEATGAVKWKSTTYDSIGASPTVSNGVVYIGSYDQNLYAFDAVTGAKLWKSPTTARIGSSPTVSNGIVYIGSFDNKLYAFDATTGALKWSTPTGGRVFSSPVVSNGTVYVGSYDKHLYAINAETGSIKWAAATGDSIRLASPIVLTYPGTVVRASISGDAQ